MEAKKVSKQCAEMLVDEQGLEALLNYLQTSEFEPVRFGIVQVLFAFVMKNQVGKFALVVQRGLAAFNQCLAVEKSAAVKFHLCAIIKEFCSGFAEDVLKENIVEVCYFL